MIGIFSRRTTSEGFETTPKEFQLPENAMELEPGLKRKLTICNLFVNHNQPIKAIARLLDIETKQVICTLIDHGMIKDRRRRVKQVRNDRRIRKYHIARGAHFNEAEDTGLCGHQDKDWIIGWFVAADVIERSEICEQCWEKYKKTYRDH